MGMPEDHAVIFRQIYGTNTVPTKTLAIYDVAKHNVDKVGTKLTPADLALISTMAFFGMSPRTEQAPAEPKKRGRPTGSKSKKKTAKKTKSKKIPAQVRADHPLPPRSEDLTHPDGTAKAKRGMHAQIPTGLNKTG